jgi:hypothetical protein
MGSLSGSKVSVLDGEGLELTVPAPRLALRRASIGPICAARAINESALRHSGHVPAASQHVLQLRCIEGEKGRRMAFRRCWQPPPPMTPFTRGPAITCAVTIPDPSGPRPDLIATQWSAAQTVIRRAAPRVERAALNGRPPAAIPLRLAQDVSLVRHVGFLADEGA